MSSSFSVSRMAERSSRLPTACYHGRQSETRGYSNENIVFQSFFMLITGQFFFFASA